MDKKITDNRIQFYAIVYIAVGLIAILSNI